VRSHSYEKVSVLDLKHFTEFGEVTNFLNSLELPMNVGSQIPVDLLTRVELTQKCISCSDFPDTVAQDRFGSLSPNDGRCKAHI
jgi:hypothetical protein